MTRHFAGMWRLLYVDDEEDIREIARLSLELDGDFDVTLSGDPTRAVELAAGLQPDLILLDFRMPEMDGLAVRAALKEEPRTAGLPVAFLTASAQKHEQRELVAAGAVGVIEKPFNPMTLAQQVRSLIQAAK